jgi:hypothetical protein
VIYCPNCRKDYPPGMEERHNAPCRKCGSREHSRCQHWPYLADGGPKQATDPRKREAMEATGRALGERQDV